MSSIRSDYRMKEHAILYPQAAAEKQRAYDQRERDTDALTLPPLQQAALLQMHESPVKRAVIARLLEDLQTKPDAADYRTLVERQLAIRNLGKRFHELTPLGIVAVRKLEAALCIRFDIHLLIEGVQVGWQQTYKCSCGKSYAVRRSPTAPGNARRQWAQEHATQDGMTKLVAALKPPLRVEG